LTDFRNDTQLDDEQESLVKKQSNARNNSKTANNHNKYKYNNDNNNNNNTNQRVAKSSRHQTSTTTTTVCAIRGSKFRTLCGCGGIVLLVTVVLIIVLPPPRFLNRPTVLTLRSTSTLVYNGNNNSSSHNEGSSSSPAVTTSTATTTATETTSSTSEVEFWFNLTYEEREQFQTHFSLDDPKYYHRRRYTPSGWWPDGRWVRECVDRPRDLEPFKDLGHWKDYRLGDCVKLCKGCPEPDSRISGPLAHWTLSGEYSDLACTNDTKHKKDEDLLEVILRKRDGKPGFVKPHPGALLIHLRLGDKIDLSKADTYTLLQDGGPAYGRNTPREIKSVYEYLANIVESRVPTDPGVMLRGGSHFPQYYVKSKTYAYCLEEAISKAGYRVHLEMDVGASNADYDFYFLSHAKKIIVGTGGFSRFIGHFVLRHGGIVFGRMF